MSAHPPGGQARRIRVLLVDDSPIAIEIIRRMLATDPGIECVGSASNGAEALALLPTVQPDVICTDLHMPQMDGFELTRAVMVKSPMPILVLSVSVQAEQSHNIFHALEAGALDVIAKPRDGLQNDFGVIAHDLVHKIRVLSGVKVIGRRPVAENAASAPALKTLAALASTPVQVIGIGASTGGPQAFEKILGQLPTTFPLPIICVQHIALGFMDGLVSWLAGICKIKVVTAQEGAPPLAGTAYFPPEDRHLEIDESGRFRCSASLPISGHRPSVDIALSSLARLYGSAALGVLLTGMGQDGAQGLLDIARAGGPTIAQDEASSIVFGMPRRAIELGAARVVLPLNQIGPALGALADRKESNNEPRR